MEIQLFMHKMTFILALVKSFYVKEWNFGNYLKKYIEQDVE